MVRRGVEEDVYDWGGRSCGSDNKVKDVAVDMGGRVYVLSQIKR